MNNDRMTSTQRISAAIALDAVDRVPCMPLVDLLFPARHMGMTYGQALKDLDAGTRAIMTVYDETGGWDGMFLPSYTWPVLPDLSSICIVTPWKLPGRELPDDAVPQYHETEIITREDYDSIVKLGWRGFAERNLERFWPRPKDKMFTWAKKQMDQYLKDIKAWQEKGVPCLLAAHVFSPLMFFSLKRTLMNFTEDLYEIPDKVADAMDAVVDDFIQDALKIAEHTKLPWVLLILERGGSFYYPLKLFERFEFPYIKKMVQAFSGAGLITCLHLDQDWTLNLPYFKDLPKGKCICEFDSTTNIFKAKEVLRNHVCIMGDVPASLTTLGKSEDVEQYCKSLIMDLGKDSGFILSSGCGIPPDCDFENFKTMVQSVKKYVP